ncbi:hypothetical protein HGRIS_009224 [Hohenbuehelia grisea]|uniref:Uncharacterized protein n=1 Tax=Hohenbuehelia grisea TaxID=104357 RepID=A0ABR3J0M1_9AGAR
MFIPTYTPVNLDEVISQMSYVHRRIFWLLTTPPKSKDEPHARPSLRNAFIKCVSQAPAYLYLVPECIPSAICHFKPPRWRYGYNITKEAALEANLERGPEEERVPPLSYFQETCDESVDPVAERSRFAGAWLCRYVSSILKERHDVAWRLVWENGESPRIFTFRDTWEFGVSLTNHEVAEISHLIFGKYVEPMWYLDYRDCFWKAK